MIPRALEAEILRLHQFDAEEGVASGNAVADHVFDTVLQPLP